MNWRTACQRSACVTLMVAGFAGVLFAVVICAPGKVIPQERQQLGIRDAESHFRGRNVAPSRVLAADPSVIAAEIRVTKSGLSVSQAKRLVEALGNTIGVRLPRIWELAVVLDAAREHKEGSVDFLATYRDDPLVTRYDTTSIVWPKAIQHGDLPMTFQGTELRQVGSDIRIIQGERSAIVDGVRSVTWKRRGRQVEGMMSCVFRNDSECYVAEYECCPAGTMVYRINAGTGEVKWNVSIPSLLSDVDYGPSHHYVVLACEDDVIVVCGSSSAGNYAEVLHVGDGRSVARFRFLP